MLQIYIIFINSLEPWSITSAKIKMRENLTPQIFNKNVVQFYLLGADS